MKNTITLLILSLHVAYLMGQSINLTGKVIDNDTKNPLPFATIEVYSLKTGTIADENGNFSIEIKVDNINKDTILFSFLGYEKEKYLIDEMLKMPEITITLKAKYHELNEVLVIPKKYKSVLLGIKDKKPWRVQNAGLFSGKLGNYVENKKGIEGWIKSVCFFIGNEGHPETPFRIRIYAVGENGLPGDDIIQKNIIVSATSPGWFKVNLTDYKIPFPEEGAFIMMEWINSGEEFYYEKEVILRSKEGEESKTEIRKYYGQTLGTVSKKPDMLLWGRGLGNDWISYKFYFRGYINAMINAEIAYPKK